jgi:phage-related baseplate assembly protein
VAAQDAVSVADTSIVLGGANVAATDAVSVADTGAAYFLFNVAASDAVSVTDTPAVEPAPADLSIGILWEDLTLWVQGVKVSGA